MTIEIGASGAANRHRDFASPTPKQVETLERFAKNPDVPAPFRDGIAHYLATGKMTFAIASDSIGMIVTHLSKAPVKPAAELGIYVDPNTGAFYLLKLSQANRFYALDLIINDRGERNPDGTWKVKPRFEWVYQNGGAKAKQLDASWKATKEQMKKWGDIWGVCLKCHAELTKQESIERGMGKTCWDKQFS